MGHSPVEEYFCNKLGNEFKYEQTKETFGIVSLPLSIMREFNIEPCVNDTPTNAVNSNFLKVNLIQVSILPWANLPTVGYSSGEFMYKYLAQCQRTKFAVAVVHTDQEIKLYHHFITNPEKKQLIKYFENSRKPDFTEFAKLWSVESCSSKKIITKQQDILNRISTFSRIERSMEILFY